MVAAQRIDGNSEDQRRVDTPRKAHQHAREPVLAYVIANAHHERFVNVRLDSRVERSADGFRRGAVEGDERDRLVPRGELLDHRARGVGNKGGAVEHELVLTAHAVGIDNRQPGFAGARAHVLAPERLLLRVVGRAVGNDDEACAGFLRLANRLREPDVFADDDPAWKAVDVDDARCAARLEVALFVEHRVIRQALLAVRLRHPTVAQHADHVVAIPVRALGESDQDRRVLHPGCKRRQLARARVEKRRPQQQILGRIARQRKLGRDHELRASALCFARGFENRRRIAGEIADDLVELRHSDLHTNILASRVRCDAEVLALRASHTRESDPCIVHPNPARPPPPKSSSAAMPISPRFPLPNGTT